MSNSLTRSVYLILKYSLKRKVNTFGALQSKKKKKNQKSRKAVSKKKRWLSMLLTIYLVVLFPALVVHFIYQFNQNLIKIDYFDKVLNENKIPGSGMSSGNTPLLSEPLLTKLDVREQSVSMQEIEVSVKDQERFVAISKEEYLLRIDNEFLKVAHLFSFDIDKTYAEYSSSGVSRIESSYYLPLRLQNNSSYIFLHSIVFIFCCFYSIFMSMAFGAKNLGATDKYLEWLSSMPIKIKHVYLIRILENSFASGINVIILLPASLTIYVLNNGVAWLPVGFVVWLVAVIFIGSFQVIIELFFQHYAGLSKAKLFQSLCNIFGVVNIFALYLGMLKPVIILHVFKFLEPYSQFMNYIPLLHLPFIGDCGFEPIVFVGLIVAGILSMMFTYYFSSYVCKDGLISNTDSNSVVKRGAMKEIDLKSSFFDPYLQLELKMLFRNKQIFVTVLILPALLFVYYYYAFDFKSESVLSPRNITLTAFALSSYVFLFTNFTFIQREGRALWFIYTQPVDPAQYLFKKIWLWSSFSFFYVLVLFGYYIFSGGIINLVFVVNAIVVLIGVAIFANLSAAIGILGVDPLDTNERKAVGQGFLYLYMMFCGVYSSGIYVDSLYTKINIVVVTFAIAVAIRGKVKKDLLYYLDPVESDTQLGLFESLLFIAFYFFIQTVSFIIFMAAGEKYDPMMTSLIASGVLLVTVFINSFFFAELKDVLKDLLPKNMISIPLLKPIVLSFVCITFAGVYLLVIKKYHLLGIDESLRHSQDLTWRVLLFVVVIAPFTEEILFRRILFYNMLKNYTPLVAIIFSSLLFGFAHPVVSFIPVFFLGCASAYTYYKTKNVYASMLVHAVYNAGAIGLNLFITAQ